MVWHLLMCEGRARRARRRGPRIGVEDVAGLAPLQSQTLSDEDVERLRNLGNNGPRDVTGHVMTHCVSNERVAIAEGEAIAA